MRGRGYWMKLHHFMRVINDPGVSSTKKGWQKWELEKTMKKSSKQKVLKTSNAKKDKVSKDKFKMSKNKKSTLI